VPMLFRIALWFPVIIIVVLGAGSNEASALRCNRDSSTCRGQPPAQASNYDARHHGRRPVARFHLRTTDCSGFDHGPVYGPVLCNFPYNCEMFDGACGDSRALVGTIGKR
jgi:hypothetical protein